jgi:hypothetical protein
MAISMIWETYIAVKKIGFLSFAQDAGVADVRFW